MCHPKARCCFLGSGLRQLPSVFWSSSDTCPKIRSIGFRSCCFWRSDGPDRQVQRLGALYPRGAVADCRGRLPGLALEIGASTGLRGTGPALAGNVGAGWAFARPRDGGQGVDVPMLAAARSRCRPGRPPESFTLPKADPSQRVGTGFLAASLTARVFVGSGNLNSQLGSTS